MQVHILETVAYNGLCRTYHMYAEVRHKANVGALGAVTRPDVSLWCSIRTPTTLEQCIKGKIRLRYAFSCVMYLTNAALLRASVTTFGTSPGNGCLLEMQQHRLDVQKRTYLCECFPPGCAPLAERTCMCAT